MEGFAPQSTSLIPTNRHINSLNPTVQTISPTYYRIIPFPETPFNPHPMIPPAFTTAVLKHPDLYEAEMKRYPSPCRFHRRHGPQMASPCVTLASTEGHDAEPIVTAGVLSPGVRFEKCKRGKKETSAYRSSLWRFR